MKNLSTGTGLALLATAIVAYPIVNRISSVDQTAHASVPVAAITAAAPSRNSAWPPSVTLEWELRPAYSWCECGDGCIATGGICLPIQHFRIDGTGILVNLSTCDFDPRDVGQLEVTESEVQINGRSWSQSMQTECTAGCCTTCGGCFMGDYLYVHAATLTFSEPVYTSVINHQVDHGGTVDYPQSEFRIATGVCDVLCPFRFTKCREDFNADGEVSGQDLAEFMVHWGSMGFARMDLDDSGAVDGGDLAVLIGAWGPCH